MTILFKQRKQNTNISLSFRANSLVSQKSKLNHLCRVVCYANFKKDFKMENKLSNQTKIAALVLGTTLDVTITAMGSKNRGIVELSNGYTILISKKFSEIEPKVLNLEDKVRIKIIKVSSKNRKFIMAELLEVLKKSTKEIALKVGEICDVTLTSFVKKGYGFAKLPGGYNLFVPNILDENSKMSKVQITRVKVKYALGKILSPTKFDLQNSSNLENSVTSFPINNTFNSRKDINNKFVSSNLTIGKKFTIILPQRTTFTVSPNDFLPLINKRVSKNSVSQLSFHNFPKKVGRTHLRTSGNYIIANLNGFVVFLKLNLGAKSGDKVQIEILKIKKKFVLARVIKVSPISRFKKHLNTKYLVKKMLKNGMHFGEKAMKCHSNMKKYIWFKKSRFDNSEVNLSHFLVKGPSLTSMKNNSFSKVKNGPATEVQEISLSNRTLPLRSNFLQKIGGIKIQLQKQKVQAKGSKTFDSLTRTSLSAIHMKEGSSVLLKQSNEKSSPFLKKGRFLVNLLKTRRCLQESTRQLAKYAVKGRTFLFIGTKKPASGLIARSALITKNSFFVNTRWLGGMLTNWKTILNKKFIFI